MNILWFALTLFGFGIILYGIFLLFAMPAVGVFLIMAGLAIMNIGLKKNRMERGSQNKEKRLEEKGLSEQSRPPIIIRILGALGGMFVGGLLGLILLALTIMITNSNFGLTNILPGGLAGAAIGIILGFIFPRVGKYLAEIFSNTRL